VSAWTNFKLTWSGPPVSTVGEAFELGRTMLSKLSPLQGQLGALRWHYKWTPHETEAEADGLRVECAFGEPRAFEIAALLRQGIAELGKDVAPESWLGDGVYDARCWTPRPTASFASVWWRWSELLVELAEAK
jgi:hypothetical protein